MSLEAAHGAKQKKKHGGRVDRIRGAPARASYDEAEKEHARRKKVQTIALTLSNDEFALASTPELVELLKACQMANASGATHLATGALKVLVRQRLPQMPLADVIRFLTLLGRLRRDLPQSQATSAVEACLDVLFAAPADAFEQLPLDRAVGLVKLLRESDMASDAHTAEVLRRVMDALPGRKHQVEPWHVAQVCQAVCRYRYASQASYDFFIDSVDVCLKHKSAFSPRDACFILDAFATVGYTPTRLFLELGQLAGDHAEELSEADTTRVIRAFKRTEIDASGLISSLRASLRLRSLAGPAGGQQVGRRGNRSPPSRHTSRSGNRRGSD